MKYRKIMQWLAAFGFFCLTGCNACTEQHDPRPDQEIFKQESQTANRELPTLKDDGSLPEKPATEAKVADAGAQTESAGAKKYQTFCASCHGANGAADGVVAAAMNPKPRAFTDAAWQDSVDDAHIAKVIKEGGAAVGLSVTMAPWGSSCER